MVAPGGAVVWVANAGSQNVEALDAKTGAVVGTVLVAGGPHGLALTPDGKELWVVAIDANAVVIVDTAQRKAMATMPVGQRPHLVVITP